MTSTLCYRGLTLHRGAILGVHGRKSILYYKYPWIMELTYKHNWIQFIPVGNGLYPIFHNDVIYSWKFTDERVMWADVEMFQQIIKENKQFL
jgi:hypothetical protein